MRIQARPRRNRARRGDRRDRGRARGRAREAETNPQHLFHQRGPGSGSFESGLAGQPHIALFFSHSPKEKSVS